MNFPASIRGEEVLSLASQSLDTRYLECAMAELN